MEGSTAHETRVLLYAFMTLTALRSCFDIFVCLLPSKCKRHRSGLHVLITTISSRRYSDQILDGREAYLCLPNRMMIVTKDINHRYWVIMEASSLGLPPTFPLPPENHPALGRSCEKPLPAASPEPLGPSSPAAASSVNLTSFFLRLQFVVSSGGGAVATRSVLSLCDSGQAEEKKRKGKTDLPQEMLSQMPLQHFPSHFIVQNGTTCTPPKGLWWPRWT
ncbi:uncharacterized protein [Tursiops truncatus]|uniref:Uncharacterized protein LOC109549788 n=1 Tax=Tursiops truncatus TaxID=9739 RepID=A0A6J3R8P1_TURTR|nr:uncharacterized protein LOC109549788 [Tursiops truncatus]